MKSTNVIWASECAMRHCPHSRSPLMLGIYNSKTGKRSLVLSLSKEQTDTARFNNEDKIDIGLSVKDGIIIIVSSAQGVCTMLSSKSGTRFYLKLLVRDEWSIPVGVTLPLTRCEVEITKPGFIQAALPKF